MSIRDVGSSFPRKVALNLERRDGNYEHGGGGSVERGALAGVDRIHVFKFNGDGESKVLTYTLKFLEDFQKSFLLTIVSRMTSLT